MFYCEKELAGEAQCIEQYDTCHKVVCTGVDSISKDQRGCNINCVKVQ